MHALVSCPFASECCRQRGTRHRDTRIVSFDRWLKSMLEKSKKEDHGEIVTLCWSIWHNKNQMLWNSAKNSVNNVVFLAKQYLTEWRAVQASSTKALYRDIIPGDGASSWVKPKQYLVKISVDAALFTEHSKHMIGLLARDDEGQVVQGRSEVFEGLVRPELAEVMAIKEALSWAKGKGWRRVVVECDCLGVIQAICSKVSMSSPFGCIVTECRRLLVELNIELFFVRRSTNMAAHFIARSHVSSQVESSTGVLFLLNYSPFC